MVNKDEYIEVLLDLYSLTPYHYARPKVGHLLPVKCSLVTCPSQTLPTGHLPPWLRPTLNCR